MKYEIDIEGLPDGWRAVAYRKPINGEAYFYKNQIYTDGDPIAEYLIIEKIPPRRIVLEETGELNHVEYRTQNIILSNEIDGVACVGIRAKYVWREVKQERES